jgi:gliding motility-associated-like protein
MGKIKYKLLIVLFFGVVSLTGAFNSAGEFVNSTRLYSNVNIASVLQPPTATISGSATVCRNENPLPQVTFTGAGGTAPYTFTYTINGGAEQTITTTGNNNSVSIGANTSNLGTFTYAMVSVEDDDADMGNVNGTVQIIIIPSPDASLGGTGEGTTFAGVPVFRKCANTTSDFTFINNTSTSSLNANYTISWGDGSPDFSQTNWVNVSHTYGVGIFDIIYTIEGNNGCTTTQNYTVFVGSNPAVSLGNPGNSDICNNSPLIFPITGADNNALGTIYTVTFNDGSAPRIFNHPPPSSITHTFITSSCDTVSSDGTNTYQNSFSAIIVASNPCSTSSVGVVPIYVSIVPEADFEIPEVACTNIPVCLDNISVGIENNGTNSSCDTSPDIVWSISPATGFNVASGSLGNDNGFSDPNLWIPGSDDLCLNFTETGTYTVTLFTGNRCGADTVVKTICVEEDLVPIFSIDVNEGCSPLLVSTVNFTDESSSCVSPTYLWEVNYIPEFCGTTASWSFTNGTDETSINPEIQFTNPGTYELILEATNTCGTISSIPQEIVVKVPPQVTINELGDLCETAPILTPSAIVNDCGPNNANYNWSIDVGASPADWEFVNGTNQNSELPEISFYTPNTYILSLEVSNSCGTDIDSEEFIFSPVPSVINTVFEQTICSGTSIEEFVSESSDPNTTYTWTGASPTGNISGVISSGTTNNIPSHLLTLNSGSTGTVIYTVIPFLVADCPGDPFEFTITVNEGPSIATQPLDGIYCVDGVANDLTFTLGGNATGTIEYQWYYNDSGTNNPADANTTAVASPEGQQGNYQPPTDALGTLYYFCVINFTGSGSCNEISTSPVAIIVNPNIVISDETPLTQMICSGANADELSFTTNNGGAGTIAFNWYLSDDNIIDNSDTPVGTTNIYDPGVLSTAGSYYYYVTIDLDESLGCSDVSSEIFVVEVIEDPEVTISPVNQTICTNVSADILVAQASGGIDINNDGTIDNADYEFQWFLNGNVITETNNADGDISTFDHDNTLPAGVYNYYCEISQANTLDCNGTSNTVTITVNEGPFIATQPLGGIYCVDGVANNMTFTLGGNAIGTIEYQWYYNASATNDPTDSNTTAVPSPEGQQANYQPPTDSVGTLYYFCVISFSGSGSCNEITTIPAEIEAIPNVVISDETPLTQIICLGASTSELSFTTNNGGAGAITYNWYQSDDNIIDNTDVPVGTNNDTYDPGILNTPGFYYYYITVDVDESLGCSDVSSEIFVVEVLEDPEVMITPVNQTICTNVSADLLVAQASGGIDVNNDGMIDNADYDFQWFLNGIPVTETNDADSDVSTFDHDNILPAGVYNYYCEISQPNALDCNGTSNTVIITVNEGPSIATQPVGDEYCLGDTMADLEVNIINGVGTPTYQWFSNNTNNTDTPDPVGIDSNILNIPNTNVGLLYYYVEITFSDGGCSDLVSEIVAININQVPEISTYEVLICSNNTFTVLPDDTIGDIVPANTTFTWSTPTVNPAGAVTGALEELVPMPNISQFLENTSLNPATVTYIVTPVSGDCVGDVFEVIVTVNPSISVTAVPVNNDCFESNNAAIEITIIGGVPFTTGNSYNITWTGPNGFASSDEDISNLEAGNYTLNIEDDGGCPYSESFIIEEPEILIFGTTDFDLQTISCFEANDGTIGITVEGGTLPYTYSWTRDGLPFSADEDLANLGPGDYEITASDANNCGPITQSFLIEEPPLLVVTLNAQTDVLCFGESTGAIAMNVVGGRPDYMYSWIGPDGFTSANQNIDTLFAGVYTVMVTDNSGCTDTLEVEIIQNDEITIDFTTTEIECYGDNDASITINTISGGEPPYDIAWSNLGTGNSQTNLSAATYTITITDAENCFRVFPIVIDEAPVFLIDPIVTQMSCSGENDASIALNFDGGIDPVTLVWDDDATAGTERNNLAPGTYSVTITDGTPCVIQDSFTIFNILPLELSANVSDALDCDDTNSGAINLLIQGGTPPFNVVWSNGDITEDLIDVPPSTYVAVVTDANDCEIEGSWDVIRFEPLVLDVETQVEADCDAQTINQTFVANASGGVPPFQFNWSSGTVSGLNNELMTTSEDGLVILEVVDSLGCTENYSLNVEVPVLGNPDFDTTSFGFLNYGVYAIQDPIEFINTATGEYESILWDFGDGSFSGEENPVHTYVEIGSYVVIQRVTFSFGCVYEKVITLIVEEGYKLIMPNAFTPNEDGLNDFFAPVQIGLNTLEINIYDTWGSLIFSESGDTIRGWNGKVKDEVAENGNYFFTFSAETFYGAEIKKQGAFVFIK